MGEDFLVHGVVVAEGAAGASVFTLYGDGGGGGVEGPDCSAESLADSRVLENGDGNHHCC